MESYKLPLPGDHISVAGSKRDDFIEDNYGTYRHHLLVVGAREEYDQEKKNRYFEIDVLHLTLKKGIVEETKKYFPGKFRIHSYEVKFSGYEAVKMGQRIKETKEGYQLAMFNCEHFVTLARTGVAQSRQVRRAVSSALGMVVGAGSGGALGTAIGGAIGSVVPIAGTILGGIVGGAIGTVSGALMGGATPFVVDYARERIIEN